MLCLASAGALPPDLGAGLGAALRAAWSGRDAYVLLDMLLKTWPMVVVAIVVMVTSAAAATGSLGWVEGGRSRLGRVGRIGSSVGLGVVAAAVIVALALAIRGVVAGAARGVDASEAGLLALWVEWLRRVLLAAGIVSLIAAALEVVMMRGAIVRALYQTRVEAEEEMSR